MITDDEIWIAMFGEDTILARVAKALYDERHKNDYNPKEPHHCSECFEGCSKCQLKREEK